MHWEVHIAYAVLCLFPAPRTHLSTKIVIVVKMVVLVVHCFQFWWILHYITYPEHGPLARYVKLQVAHAPGMPGTFFPPPWVSDPDMHHGTCVTHVPWCMPGSLTSGFLCSQWRGKRSRHSWRMRNPQFWVSGKMPIVGTSSLLQCKICWYTGREGEDVTHCLQHRYG